MTDPVYAWDRPAGLSPHASGRSVWAWWHYFQRAFTDQPVASDYYTTQFLNPHGQGSSAWGSYIKDRPLSRPTIGGGGPAWQEEWRKVDMHNMCMDAYDCGLDGFQMNCINHYDTTQDGAALPNILEGAKRSAASGKPIKIMFMSDGVTGSQTPASAKAALFRKYMNYPHVLKTSDGKLVLGSFGPELSAGGNPAHWQQIIAEIGAPVYFMPTFLNPNLCMASQWLWTQGAAIWGGNVLSTQAQMLAIGKQVMGSGREWMPTCFPQDYRPNFNSGAIHQYYETGNSQCYRIAWRDAIAAHQHNPAKSKMVSIATWNDYSEHNHVGPSEPGKGIQNFFRDLSAYYAIKYKTGASPVMKRDQIALLHRPERTDTWPQTGSGQPSNTKNASAAPADVAQNNIEAIAYLTSSAVLEVDRGDGMKGTASGTDLIVASVGMITNKTPVARLVRNNAVVLSLTSAFPVRAASTSQDLQYKGTTSIAQGGGEPPITPPEPPVQPPPTPPPVEGGWTPDALKAKVLIYGPNATFSGGAGSALTALPNAGSELVGASILGPPTKGNDINNLATIRADAAAEMLKYQLSGTPAGGMWFFWYGRTLTTASDQAFIGLNWPTPTAGVAAYLCSTGPAKSVAMGNGYLDDGPRFYTPGNTITDAGPHSLFSQLGMANSQRLDGEDIEITSSIIGDVPAYPADEWTMLHSGAGHEVVNADTLVLIMGVGTLDTPDIERLEGWAHWMGGTQAMLGEHPYSDAPPMLDEVPPEPPEPEDTIEVDMTGQFEHEGKTFEVEGTLEITEKP
jgi:hypothetical protein